MDNNGEGGTLSLTALAFRAVGRRTPDVLVLGVVGAAMFYGSSLITPALSVLSAVEGLKLATPAFEPYVLPITIVLLVGLFASAIARDGQVSGPVRPDHGRLVYRCDDLRRTAYCRRSRRAGRDQPVLCDQVSH